MKYTVCIYGITVGFYTLFLLSFDIARMIKLLALAVISVIIKISFLLHNLLWSKCPISPCSGFLCHRLRSYVLLALCCY